MTYTKYGTKSSTLAVPAPRKDISKIPFGDIEKEYKRLLEFYTQEELTKRNEYALDVHNRLVAKTLASRSASSEENPDDIPDFQPIEYLDADTAKKYKALANEEAVVSFVEKHDITNSWSWLAPQVIAYLGTYTLPTKVGGLIRCTDFLNLNVKTDFDLGLYRMFAKVPRGRLMKNQTSEDHLPVCALVPIHMAAQKFSNSTKYSEWSREDIHLLVDEELSKAMLAPALPGPYDTNELLAIRNTGLRYVSKSKKEMGVVKHYNPQTYHMLSGVSDSLVGGLSKYAKAMLCQIWCAHPNNRTKYMILDPYNWDNIPAPLINTQVVEDIKVDIPWE